MAVKSVDGAVRKIIVCHLGTAWRTVRLDVTDEGWKGRFKVVSLETSRREMYFQRSFDFDDECPNEEEESQCCAKEDEILVRLRYAERRVSWLIPINVPDAIKSTATKPDIKQLVNLQLQVPLDHQLVEEDSRVSLDNLAVAVPKPWNVTVTVCGEGSCRVHGGKHWRGWHTVYKILPHTFGSMLCSCRQRSGSRKNLRKSRDGGLRRSCSSEFLGKSVLRQDSLDAFASSNRAFEQRQALFLAELGDGVKLSL